MTTQSSHAYLAEAVENARNYYNSDDAENFYSRLWGGQDLHLGIYEFPTESIFDASRRTIERMAERIEPHLEHGAHVLDIGGGYGGSARYLAECYDVSVVCLNLSEVQNERGRAQTEEVGLSDRVRHVDGNFEAIPYGDDSFDVVWSQDALLHSGDREQALREVARVLKPGGVFILTDPMMSENCSPADLRSVLDRIQLSTMGSYRYYKKTLASFGLDLRTFDNHSAQLSNHYGAVLRELERREDQIEHEISESYRQSMKRGLKHWIDASESGRLEWGILVADKPH